MTEELKAYLWVFTGRHTLYLRMGLVTAAFGPLKVILCNYSQAAWFGDGRKDYYRFGFCCHLQMFCISLMICYPKLGTQKIHQERFMI